MSAAIKVSVLTPVYNAQPYLRACLDSLAAQTLPDIEFVCIDDGSTDESLHILQQYAHADARFKVLTQDNCGYGAAMNRAMRTARGEYIGILEPDDYIEPRAYELLYGAARETGMCDYVVANYRSFNDDGEVFHELYSPDLCGEAINPLHMPRTVFSATLAIWSGLYRRSFLTQYGIDFLKTPGASFQDTGFVSKCRCAASSVCFVHDAFVHYRTGNPSASTSSRENAFCIIGEYDSAEVFLNSLDRMRQTALAPWLAYQKYRGYRWNVKRIADQRRDDFAKAAAEDFEAMQAVGLLDETCYSQKEWAQLQAWISDPKSIVLSTRAQEAHSTGHKLAYWHLRLRRKMRLEIRGVQATSMQRRHQHA